MTQKNKPEPIYCSDLDAAAMLGVSRSKVWTLAKSGLLTPISFPPRTVRFSIEQIKGFGKPKTQ